MHLNHAPAQASSMSKLHRSLSDCSDSCCETATANMATRNRLKQEMHGNAASENLIRICNYLYIKDIRIKGRTHNPSISGSSPTVKPWGITLLGKRSVPMDFFWALESVGTCCSRILKSAFLVYKKCKVTKKWAGPK